MVSVEKGNTELVYTHNYNITMVSVEKGNIELVYTHKYIIKFYFHTVSNFLKLKAPSLWEGGAQGEREEERRAGGEGGVKNAS